MLEQIEKLFPGFLSKVREFPVIARAILALLILAGPTGLAWTYSHVSASRIPPNMVALSGLAAISLGIIFLMIEHQRRLRRKLQRFLAYWLEFRDRFQLLCVRIDAYLIRDRRPNATSTEESLKRIDELLPAIKEYWSLRGRLCEDMFRMGENRLSVNHSVRWESLKRRKALVNGYATPFSFLLDRGQPIAEWNLHHDEIWEALYIADEFVEYLCFRHPALKQLAYAVAVCFEHRNSPYRGKDLVYVGRVRNGFVPASRRQVFEKIRHLVSPTMPFANLPDTHKSRWGDELTAEKMKECVWLRPEAVARIEFLEWTEADRLRHSKFAGLREDKGARTVVKEHPGEA